MKWTGSLREKMPAGPIRFPVLNPLTNLDRDFGSQALPITGCSHEPDLKPVLAIPLIMKEKLRTLYKLSVILTVGDKEIKESVVVIIAPGSPTPTAKYRDVNPFAPCHIGEGSIVIILVKIIWPFSLCVVSGVDDIQIQVTVVIIVSPCCRPIIAESP